jgi:uncharacterized protein
MTEQTPEAIPVTEQTPKTFPGIGQSIVIFFVLILSMLVFAPILILFERFGLRKEYSFLIYYVFSMGAPTWYYWRVKKGISGISGINLSVTDGKVLALVIVGTIFLGLGIISPLVNLIPMTDWIKELMRSMGSPTHVGLFLAIVVAAPVLEEIIFRGVILDGLLKKYSPSTSIIVSSILFGLIHFNPWQFVSAFLGGIFIGWVYYRTRNLSLAIIIHATNNLFFTLPAFFMSEEEYFSFDTPIIEYYGGIIPFTLILSGSIAIFFICVWTLKKRFEKGQQSAIE